MEYRRINRIPDEWGTAVNVQQMVFGNKGDTSCSGVAFSRDEITGAPRPSGDFLPNAQGEDVVSGVRTPRDLHELKDDAPTPRGADGDPRASSSATTATCRTRSSPWRRAALYMLQTRNAKRPAQAAVRFAVDAVERGAARQGGGARARSRPDRLDALLHPAIARDADYEVLAEGVAASPGAAKGAIVFTAADAVAAAEDGPRRDPRAPVHRGRRRGRLPRRQGDPHLRGRQGQPRGARGARDGQAVRVRRRRRSRSTWPRRRCA